MKTFREICGTGLPARGEGPRAGVARKLLVIGVVVASAATMGVMAWRGVMGGGDGGAAAAEREAQKTLMQYAPEPAELVGRKGTETYAPR